MSTISNHSNVAPNAAVITQDTVAPGEEPSVSAGATIQASEGVVEWALENGYEQGASLNLEDIQRWANQRGLEVKNARTGEVVAELEALAASLDDGQASETPIAEQGRVNLTHAPTRTASSTLEHLAQVLAGTESYVTELAKGDGDSVEAFVEVLRGLQLGLQSEAAAFRSQALPDGSSIVLAEEVISGLNGLAHGNSAQFRSGLEHMLGGTSSLQSMDVMALIQWVMRESYMQSVEDMRYRAEKVKSFNEQKKAVREHLSYLRSIQSQFVGIPEEERANYDLTGAPTSEARREALDELGSEGAHELGQAFASLAGNEREEYRNPRPQYPHLDLDTVNGVIDGVMPNPEGPPFLISNGSRIETLADLTNHIQSLEDQLNGIGEDSQLANIDLQNALQAMQQTLQTISNISKNGHETAMGVIRNLS